MSSNSTIKRGTLPELLERDDVENGQWSIGECAAERGAPRTNIGARQMFVPQHDHELSRVIRAHEMMHAKVSPAQLDGWLARSFASEYTMRCVEELRVNTLCERAGFPVGELLKDGTEFGRGVTNAMLNEWESTVLFAVACANSAGYEEFLNGVFQEKPEWREQLTTIVDKCVDYVGNIKTADMMATTSYQVDIAPDGFAVTERVAAWLDGVIGQSNPSTEGALTPAEIRLSKIGSDQGYAEEEYTSSPISEAPAWGKLITTTARLDAFLAGSIAKRRRPSDVGRNPRRINRMLTDPGRRVFDSRRRSNGGIVLLDASGSMEMDEDDIKKIVMLAPSATVAMYAEDGAGEDGIPNLHILAKNGRFASRIPKRMIGNNVDLPALQWAVAQRRSIATPVIWVTDGGVTASNGFSYDQLAVQCVNFCKKHNVIIVENQEALRTLITKMGKGIRPKTGWPHELARAYTRATGRKL